MCAKPYLKYDDQHTAVRQLGLRLSGRPKDAAIELVELHPIRLLESLCRHTPAASTARLARARARACAAMAGLFAADCEAFRRRRAAAAAEAEAAARRPRKVDAKISQLDEQIKALSVINRYRTRPVSGPILQWPDGVPPTPEPDPAELDVPTQADYEQQMTHVQRVQPQQQQQWQQQQPTAQLVQSLPTPETGARSMPSDLPTIDADAASVIVIMGVCGSGKSTVGQAVAEHFGLQFHDADDFHSTANKERMASGTPLTDEDRSPWLAAMAEAASTWSAGAVLACSALKQSYRDVLRGGCSAMAFVFLDVPAQVLEERMAGREHFMPSSLIESQLAALEPPTEDEEGALVIVPRSMASSPVDAVTSFVCDRLAIHRLACQMRSSSG